MGANPIPMPKKKKGFVSRKQIELDIKTYLQGHGLPNANSIARSTISDFKKYAAKQNLNGAILNENQKGLEQYSTQELGLWLFETQGHLKNYTSRNCPFSKPIVINPLQLLSVEIGQVVATGASTNDELIEEIRNTTALLLDCQKELRATQQELENLKKRDETIRLKKSIAGKKGGRGNES
jgi:hypothetical protein